MANANVEKIKNEGEKLISKDSVESLTESVNHITDRVREVTDDTVTKSLEYAKKYPVYTFIGAVALGFVSGLIVKSLSPTVTTATLKRH